MQVPCDGRSGLGRIAYVRLSGGSLLSRPGPTSGARCVMPEWPSVTSRRRILAALAIGPVAGTATPLLAAANEASRIRAYAIGLAGSRRAMLRVAGVAPDVRIAIDPDIGDVIDITDAPDAIDVLAETASGRRSITIPTIIPSTMARGMTSLSQIIMIGQSNTDGHTGGSAITTTPLNPGRALTFAVGERLLGTSQELNDLDKLARRQDLRGLIDLVAVNRGSARQTVAPTMADGLLARRGAGLAILVANVSIGACRYIQRRKGTPVYRNAMLAVEIGATDAHLSGCSHDVRYIVVIDGESDASTPKATWMADKREERANFDADIKAINGQTDDVVLMTDQMGVDRWGVTLAQLQLAIDDPDHFICVGPKYHLPAEDTVHITQLSQAIHGYAFARAANRKDVDKVNPLPLYMVSAVRTGLTVECTFGGDFVAPIVIDTTTVADPGNYGLIWLDDNDGNSVSITKVGAVTGGRKIMLTLSAIPTGTNPRIGTARAPLSHRIGPVAGARSCIRDSSPDTCTIAGTAYKLHRWACHWETPVTTS